MAFKHKRAVQDISSKTAEGLLVGLEG